MSVYELSAQEIYDSYAQDVDPNELAQQSRTDLATKLRVDEGLNQKEAYFVADQLLVYAQQHTKAQR